MDNFIGGKLIDSKLELHNKTVVKISYHTAFGAIKEMEILKIIYETEKVYRLSNGISVAKNCLFPYHRKNFRQEIEYYFIDKIII